MTTENDAWDKITEQLPKYGINTLIVDLADGLQYESHPEIAIDGAWTKYKMKEQIDRLNKVGIEVVPKMNFATIHDVWLGKYSRMVSTSIYYKEVEDLIDRACLFAVDI